MRIDRSLIAHLDQRSFGAAAGVFPQDGMRHCLAIGEGPHRELLELRGVARVLQHSRRDRLAPLLPHPGCKSGGVSHDDEDGETSDRRAQIEMLFPPAENAAAGRRNR
jgi:hypothetical protein